MFTSELTNLASGFQFTEGPVWHKAGYLLFSDIPANRIYQWDQTGAVKVWRENSGQSNGLTWDCQGRLIACEHWNRCVSCTESDGRRTVIADRYQGKLLNSPNDCTVRSDGMIYFTDPPYGIGDRIQELPFSGVFRVNPGEKPVLLEDQMVKPNGLAFAPDESLLYVADTEKHTIYAFSVESTGALKHKKPFCSAERPDGMKVDCQGNLYIAARQGIAVFDPQGKPLEFLEMPQRPANCVFGDTDYRTLYITARSGLYSIRTMNPGIGIGR